MNSIDPFEQLNSKRISEVARLLDVHPEIRADLETQLNNEASSSQSILGLATSSPEASDADTKGTHGPSGAVEREINATIKPGRERPAEMAVVLDSIVGFVRRFVSVSLPQAQVIALWAAHTHVLDAFDATPYLSITSAEKQSGKTRLLEVLELIVAKPWLTGRVTAAVLTRKTDAVQPTILLDECDAAFAGEKEYAEALRGVLNTGHRRGGKASCCVGQGTATTFKDFSTFCPKAIAGIGNLPDTVADRSVCIRLKRASRGESVERFRLRDVKAEATSLVTGMEQWSAGAIEVLRTAHPDLPDSLTDRQQDAAEPLLAIADFAGCDWPGRARTALVLLCAEGQANDQAVGTKLLADIDQIFNELGVDRIASAALVGALGDIETSPWAEWTRDKPLRATGLAKLLKPYGIFPATIRIEGTTPKGYLKVDFQDAFERYLPIKTAAPVPPSDSRSATTQQTTAVAVSCDISIRNAVPDDAALENESVNKNATCCGVAEVSAPHGAEEEIEVEIE
jgi:hypothetical protein